MQKLIMPMREQFIICGYKNIMYSKQWGYPHYGIDLTAIQGDPSNLMNDHNIYSSGNGTVLFTGFDNSGGNVVGVLYEDVYNHKTSQTTDVVAIYMHLERTIVKEGQIIDKDNIIGVEGKTKTAGHHLHIEFSTNIVDYKNSPQVSSRDDGLSESQGNILKHGDDCTVNPSYILHVSADRLVLPSPFSKAWINDEDENIPVLEVKETATVLKEEDVSILEVKEDNPVSKENVSDLEIEAVTPVLDDKKEQADSDTTVKQDAFDVKVDDDILKTADDGEPLDVSTSNYSKDNTIKAKIIKILKLLFKNLLNRR